MISNNFSRRLAFVTTMLSLIPFAGVDAADWTRPSGEPVIECSVTSITTYWDKWSSWSNAWYQLTVAYNVKGYPDSTIRYDCTATGNSNSDFTCRRTMRALGPPYRMEGADGTVIQLVEGKATKSQACGDLYIKAEVWSKELKATTN